MLSMDSESNKTQVCLKENLTLAMNNELVHHYFVFPGVARHQANNIVD